MSESRKRVTKGEELAAVIAGLREFNARGLAAIERLSAVADDLQRRVAMLEEFQKTLEASGDRREAN